MSTSLRHIIGATFVTQVAAFLMTVGGQVLAARWLGPLQFGVMATLLMFADAVNKFTNFGLETSILYFVSNRRYPFRRFIGTNIINGLVLYGVGVLAILGFIAAGGISLLFRPEEAVLGMAGIWWSMYCSLPPSCMNMGAISGWDCSSSGATTAIFCYAR